jgi:DNA-binding GntR family transcriptional regulator
MSTPAPSSFPGSAGADVLRDRVYVALSKALMSGRHAAGQKITIRALAAEYGTSLTPVREALRRLVAEGVLEGAANRSVYVPLMTSSIIRELRDIRIAVEGLAAARAAERISQKNASRLRKVAAELAVARSSGNIDLDVAKQAEFQFGVYRASDMPNLVRIIEGLWLRTGPYLRLLFPGYIATLPQRRGDWRKRLCAALDAHDPDAARREIEDDISQALDYLATLVDAATLFRPQAGRR